MAMETTDADFLPPPSAIPAEDESDLYAAHAQAVAELNRLRAKASVDDTGSGDNANYSMHEVSGVGRYVIPRRTGWRALVDIIHDPVPNIDFSANIYPAFDGIVGDHFQSPHFLDPLDDQYESRSYLSLHPGRRPYEDLRDNVAAVRNFLMQTYYDNTPDGMTPDKAKKALAEIAAFVGDGLYNNWLFLNIIPNHKFGEPFIDLSRAQAPNGEGAQYIYTKILEQQRHSGWLRPFAALTSLFGGNQPPDWKLPPASETHFTDRIEKDIGGGGQESSDATPEDIAATVAAIAAIEERLTSILDARMLSNVAIDLDALGNHLLYTVQNLNNGVAHISEPVRRDAVEIARDILRKLKLSIGDINVIDGLKLQPTDDLAALGAVKGVAMLYERLLAWVRGNNDTAIFQNPSVCAATQAIGQLGYVAKLEARRMALIAGNSGMASAISEQIKRIPVAYSSLPDNRFGALLDTVERGIETILNRVQQVSVSGVKIGKSVDNRSTSMDATPTAGNANLVGVDQAAQRNAQILTAQQLAALAQAQRANRQAQNAAPMQPQGPARSAAPVRQPQRQPRQSNFSNFLVAPAGVNPAALSDAQRNAANLAALQAAHEHHEQEEMQRRQLLLNQQKLNLAKAAAAKIDTNTIRGIQAATNLKGITGTPIMGGGRRLIDSKQVMKSAPKTAAVTSDATAPKPAVATDDEKQKNPYALQPSAPPPQGRSR